ncbi:glyoxylase-like metal-dependent hydrolase (beta-lactamase superfamily II) [Paenibacillus taihuensis]|uniref:Glyoxylase-like metal-dependent hydrolase (Beta-lactamase superfamily II) n=1 Tax=Paenibacillus taihuensis TaxID=1156355 RepID=A0A3D9R3V6_9BACL|nr:MBL fold metallo-hydrolase [Paenibacillus taihuensis]REE68012.1 glyoxylase-like metal-dependent hydrolase (beta-lactamase superfamily II) [Paenibacillus taihuensis]
MIKLQDGPLTLFESALYKTMSAVVETVDAVIIVDPCWLPHEVEEIRQYADNLAGDRSKYVLFTHSDFDHIIGYGAFADAAVIASAALADKPDADKEAILEQIRDFEHSYYLERDYEIAYPTVTHRAEADGQVLNLSEGGTRLTFYQAPGHNNDGIYTVIEPLGLLFAGDYWSDIEFPYIYFSSTEYETSIRKLDTMLANRAITRLIPGHGNSTTDHGEMKRRQESDLAYIAAMRAAVRAGDQAAIDRLIEGCKFPRNMRKFHRGNQTLFERELQISE